MTTTSPFSLALQTHRDTAEIEGLLDGVFGLARRAKTSYRLREGVEPIHALSMTAREGGRLVGAISYSPVMIGPDGTRALLLGPLAVHPERQNCGIGLGLMRTTLEKARALGHELVILVGDEPYYRRVGFARVPQGRLLLPGPVEPGRLLFRELEPGAFEGVSGLVLSPWRWHEAENLAALAVPGQAHQCQQGG